MFNELHPDNAVCGIRFQPIYSLANKKIVAWEVLSYLHSALDAECFFSSQTDDVFLDILCWQFEMIKELKKTKRCFLNIPASLLYREDVVQYISGYLRNNTIMEVQDPHNFIDLYHSDRDMFHRNIERIKSCGASIWLDDVLPEHIKSLSDAIMLFNGVKIDKSVLHSASTETQVFNHLIEYCRTRVDSVLAEGVENNQHYMIAKNAGCHFLQGFLWPEERFSLYYKSVNDDQYPH